MCGIVGTVNWSRSGSTEQEATARMLTLVHHRGPDQSKLVRVSPFASFGVARLAVVDKTNSVQPMRLPGTPVYLAFNGEIYNYRELRDELMRSGVRFTTAGEAEVLLHLYHKYGEAFADCLDGMFAFAVWDGRSHRLLLGRDRYGIKPLYYGSIGPRVCFSSEIRSLVCGLGVVPKLREEGLHEYLAIRFTTTGLLEEVSKVTPGAVVSLAQNGIRRRTAVSAPPFAIGSFGTVFQEAVKSTADCNEQLGILLSGGIDSSAIAATVPEQFGVSAFTARYPGAHDTDERDWGRLVASHLGMHHCLVNVPPGEIPGLVYQAVRSLEEPLYSPIAVTTLALARAVSGSVRVVLSGDGSDELFSSYPRLLSANEIARQGGDWYEHYATALGWMPTTLARRIAPWSQDTIAILAELKSSGLAVRSPIEAMRTFELRYKLPDYHLHRVDRLFMSLGIEVRLPYLRNSVAQWCIGQNAADLASANPPKRHLRNVVRHRLPPATVARPKQSFGAPVEDWILGPLKSQVNDLFFTSGYHQDLGLELVGLKRLMQLLHHNPINYCKTVWGLAQLFFWYEYVFRVYSSTANSRTYPTRIPHSATEPSGA